METQVEFLEWKPEVCIIEPFLFMSSTFPNTTFKKGNMLDSEIAAEVQKIYKTRVVEFSLSENMTRVILDQNNSNSVVIAVCLLIRLGYTKDDALQIIKKDLTLEDVTLEDVTLEDLKKIDRYKKPLNVIFCGDRNSCVCFEERLIMELKNLPKYSLVVHGGCRGLDLYADELAKQMNIVTQVFEPDWSLGFKAGPIRNSQMLEDVVGGIDMVLAFHPDIQMSKGTKNMMVQAHRKQIPVYIHDMKRKMKFEGDFSVL
jgi:YspA, cpYpsA-related SLOG family